MILILRALGVGDLAASVPALRAIRAAFPAEPVAVATPSWLTPLIDLIGGIDEVVPTDDLTPQRWGIGPPRIAVNLHGRGPESHRLLMSAKPAELWAHARPDAGHAHGPTWAEEDHEVRRWCRLVEYYGPPADPSDLTLSVPTADVPRGVTIVHPGAKSPARRWPHFTDLAGRLADAGHRVVVTGTEEELVRRVANGAGVPAQPTTLTELAGLVAHARLVISGDTGIAHLATAYATPSVVLFGPVPPRSWGPPADRPWHRVIWHDCGHTSGPHVRPGLLTIGVDEVVAEIEQAERHARSLPRRGLRRWAAAD